MKNKIYKAVVIGCGRIGAEKGNYKKDVQPGTHAGAYDINPRIELAGLTDIDKKRLRVAEKYFPGVPLFDSAQDMFKKIRPDIVSIATNPDSHALLVKLAAMYKTPAIVCEKPIAETIKQAKEMIRVCKKNKCLLFINHLRRFDPLLWKWRIKIKKNLIGDIIQGNCYYYNGLFNNGTHSIDLLRFFLGKIDWVKAVTNIKTSWDKRDKNVDALISFKNGAQIVMQSLPQNYGFFNFYFYGTKGYFALKNLGYEIEYRKLIKNRYFRGYYQLSDKAEQEGGIRSFMKAMASHVVFCLDNQKKPLSTGEDGLAVLNVLFALRKSAEKDGKIIKL